MEADADTETLWVREAERRLDELRTGRVKGRPATSVFQGAIDASVTRVIFHPEAEAL